MARPKAKSKRRPILCLGKPVSLIVLAGGRSRRMGRSKALLPVAGGTLLEHVLAQVEGYFDDIVISLSPGHRLALAGSVRRTRLVRDAVPGRGPMEGLLAGLKAARHDVCAVIACDIPEVSVPFLRRLIREAAAGYEAVVPVSADGLMEPLFAVYRRTAAPYMEKLLASGRRSLLPLFETANTFRYPLLNSARLKNLNTPEEYRAYLESVALTRRSGGRKLR